MHSVKGCRVPVGCRYILVTITMEPLVVPWKLMLPSVMTMFLPCNGALRTGLNVGRVLVFGNDTTWSGGTMWSMWTQALQHQANIVVQIASMLLETSWLLLMSKPFWLGYSSRQGHAVFASALSPCVFGKVPLKKLVDSAYVAANKWCAHTTTWYFTLETLVRRKFREVARCCSSDGWIKEVYLKPPTRQALDRVPPSTHRMYSLLATTCTPIQTLIQIPHSVKIIFSRANSVVARNWCAFAGTVVVAATCSSVPCWKGWTTATLRYVSSPSSPVSTTVTATAFHLPRHAGDDGAAVQPVALREEATVLPLGRPLVLGLGPLMVGG